MTDYLVFRLKPNLRLYLRCKYLHKIYPNHFLFCKTIMCLIFRLTLFQVSQDTCNCNRVSSFNFKDVLVGNHKDSLTFDNDFIK